VSLSVQEEVLRGGVEELGDVVRLVAARLGESEGLHEPVLLQVLRVRVIVELLEHLANLRDGRSAWLLH
jgi:hypothetical protein